MLGELELYVYEKYIKEMIVEENGVKKISEKDLENLKLSPQEKKFIIDIINKHQIQIIEEKITKEDRSPYVKDNNYGDIQAYGLQKLDEPVKSKIEYSATNEKVFEDYKELDEYLETRFIPTYVLLKKGKKTNGEIEYFPSIRLHHIMALKLSEAELEHVMNYLKEKNIRVGGKGSTFEEFENYDYVTTYKESALPLSVPANVTLQKLSSYRQNKDSKLRDEIILDNMRLVPYVAYRYAIATKIDQHDLESYGYEGLILAIENFDVNCSWAFSTYAVSYIRGYILKGIQEILYGKKDTFYYDYVNAKAAVEKECGVTLAEEPDLIDDVIDLLVATGKIKGHEGAKEYARMRINSLAIGDASLDDEETVEDLLTTDELVDTHDYAEEVINSLSKPAIEKLLNTLTTREQEILRLRFGFDNGIPKSLDEIAIIFGLSVERIRQIEAKALRKLRRPSRSKILKDYLDNETEKYGR